MAKFTNEERNMILEHMNRESAQRLIDLYRDFRDEGIWNDDLFLRLYYSVTKENFLSDEGPRDWDDDYKEKTMNLICWMLEKNMKGTDLTIADLIEDDEELVDLWDYNPGAIYPLDMEDFMNWHRGTKGLIAALQNSYRFEHPGELFNYFDSFWDYDKTGRLVSIEDPKAFMRYLETQTTPEEFWNNFSSNPDFMRDATLKELEWIACNALPLLPIELEDLVESVDCNCYKEVK